jgi:hypothetical protein
VPVVLDGDCTRQPVGAAFMKRLARHFANETAVATPNGKVLSPYPDQGLAKWKDLALAERQKLDDLGQYDPALDPHPPEGGLVLKVFARPLERDKSGQLQIYRHPKAHLSHEPGRDFLWLTRNDWQALIPPSLSAGQKMLVPRALTDRLCRRYLIDLVRIGGEGGPRNPKDVLTQELTLTVEGVSAGEIRLRLDGLAKFITHGAESGVTDRAGRTDTFPLLGYLTYDRAAKKMTRFDVVAVSETGHYDQIGRQNVALGIAFVLTTGDRPADQVRPHSFFRDYFAGK